MGVLDEIIAHKRGELARQRAERSLGELERACRGLARPRDFGSALRPRAPHRISLIAEVKKASPSHGVLNADLDPVSQARTYAGSGAAAVSVLTDRKYFRGSLDDLVAVRAALDQQTLRDLMQAAREMGLGVLVEVHTADELERALALAAPVIGVNNRDLHTLKTSLAPSLSLLPLIPPGPVAVSESGISTGAEVERVIEAGAHAILVGEGLVRATDVSAKVKELLLATP